MTVVQTPPRQLSGRGFCLVFLIFYFVNLKVERIWLIKSSGIPPVEIWKIKPPRSWLVNIYSGPGGSKTISKTLSSRALCPAILISPVFLKLELLLFSAHHSSIVIPAWFGIKETDKLSPAYPGTPLNETMLITPLCLLPVICQSVGYFNSNPYSSFR